MKANRRVSMVLVSLLLIAASGPVVAQTPPADPNDHHPAETRPGAGADAAGSGATPSAQPPMGGMMGMMTPEMMQMMQRMMSQGGMPGMMGGQGMMGQGRMPGMMGGQGMSGMMGQGGMRGPMAVMGVLYGMPDGAGKETTPAQVRAWLEERLEWHGNPRLKIGEIASATDGTITAEIVTVDGSLVQKLAFNRYPGFVRQVTE